MKIAQKKSKFCNKAFWSNFQIEGAKSDFFKKITNTLKN